MASIDAALAETDTIASSRRDEQKTTFMENMQRAGGSDMTIHSSLRIGI
jgi:hypothetical protein